MMDYKTGYEMLRTLRDLHNDSLIGHGAAKRVIKHIFEQMFYTELGLHECDARLPPLQEAK